MNHNTSNFSQHQIIDTSISGYGTRVLDPVLAISIGNVNAALLVQQLDYWIQKGMGLYYKGRNWVWNTLDDWRNKSNLPFLSKRQIRTAIAHLENLGVIEKDRLNRIRYEHPCCRYDRTLYYTIDYDRLNELLRLNLSKQAHDKNITSEVMCQDRQIYTKKTSKDNIQKQTHTQEAGEKNVSTDEILETERQVNTKEVGLTNGIETNYHDRTSQQTLEKKKVTPPVVLKKDKQLQKGTIVPWKSKEELDDFYRALVAALPQLGAISGEAVARKTIKDMRDGLPCSYWDDWKAGVAIGTSSMQEWEISPGVVAPKFIEYLRDKIKDPRDTPENALIRVGKLLKDKTITLSLWNEFKRNIEVLRQDNEKAVAEGRQPYVPVWFTDRADVPLERAADSANYLNDVNPTSDWVDDGMKGKKPAHLQPQSEFDTALHYTVRDLKEAQAQGYETSAKRAISRAKNLAKTEEDEAKLNSAIKDIYPELLSEKKS